MKGIRERIETIANIIVILFALYYGGSFVKQYIFPSKAQSSEKAQKKHSLNVGNPIALSDVEWSEQSKTLVLAISPGCEFCAKNAPLYKLLSQTVKKRTSIKLLPLLPESSGEGEAFLNELGIEVDEIRKASFKEIGIDGTPTIILADSRGIVSKMWTGALSPSQEAEVINSLEEDTAVTYISIAELKHAMDNRENIAIVDINDRENYALEHISTAKNIPVDELQSRALQELPADSRIVLYCGCRTDDLGRIAVDILSDTLSRDAKVSVLKGGLNAWAGAGLPTASKQLTKYNQ